MKLFMILMCCFTFSLSANSFAQQEKVNLDLRDVSIKTLFSEIQRQTKLHFIFSSEQANRLDKLTVKATDETVKSVLDRIFEGTGFSYTFRDDIIMVRFEGEKAAQQVKKEMEIRGSERQKRGSFAGSDGACGGNHFGHGHGWERGISVESSRTGECGVAFFFRGDEDAGTCI